MTAAQVALQVQGELATNDDLLERLKQGDPGAFEKLNLNFEQIYASTEPQSHGLRCLTSNCSIAACTYDCPFSCDRVAAD